MKKIINIKLPHSWKDLTNDELVHVSGLLLEKKDEYNFKINAFLFFSKLRILRKIQVNKNGDSVYLFRDKRNHKFRLSADEINFVINTLDWLTKPPTEFTPVTVIGKYKARDTMLYDCTFGEFINGLVYYNNIKSIATDIQYLYKLSYLLYNNGKWAEDNEEKKAIYFKKISLPILYTSYLWFGFVLSQVVKECDELFSEGSGDSPPP